MAHHAQKQLHPKKQAPVQEHETKPKRRSPPAAAADLPQVIADITHAGKDEILQLQRIAGNRAVNGLIQAQLQEGKDETRQDLAGQSGQGASQASQVIQRNGGGGAPGDAEFLARMDKERQFISDVKAGKFTDHQIKAALRAMGQPKEEIRAFLHTLHEAKRANLKASLKASLGFEVPERPAAPIFPRMSNKALIDLVSNLSID